MRLAPARLGRADRGVRATRRTGEPLRDPPVIERIAAAFEREGADAWFTTDPPERFLGPDRDPADYEQVDRHRRRLVRVRLRRTPPCSSSAPELAWPADLYLEGSDQHRGWFHSSLLESCGTRGRAPYEAVLTHGFVVDEHGRKMSKSLGNVVSPLDLMKTSGADILRLWTVGADYAEDVRIGEEILAGQADAYRRLRNTLRYLLGALAGFSPSRAAAGRAQMPELERWVLHRLAELDRLVREANRRLRLPAAVLGARTISARSISRPSISTCARTRSTATGRTAHRRRAVRTVLDQLFDCLTAWLAPVLVFTAEEAWLARHPAADGSVHLRLFPTVPAAWHDPALGARWERVRRVRRVVTGALEVERAGEADRLEPGGGAGGLFVDAADRRAAGRSRPRRARDHQRASSCASRRRRRPTLHGSTTSPGVGVVPGAAAGRKCARCWQVLPEVGSRRRRHPISAGAVSDAVAALAAA